MCFEQMRQKLNRLVIKTKNSIWLKGDSNSAAGMEALWFEARQALRKL